jgi:hypothetical protein
MSNSNSFFDAVSGSPRPIEIDSLFGGGRESYTVSDNSSNLLQELVQEVNDQGTELNSLVSAVTGKSGGSVAEGLLGSASLGGSVLGGVASAAKGGFSWQSVLSDIFPVGGLISGIASLFDSPPAPPVLDQYAAPPQLNFDAVLNSNGTLSQGADNQYGFTQSTGTGLDLADAEGGPYSPYTRATDGSLVPAAGDPVYQYSGQINLPDLVGNTNAAQSQQTSGSSSSTAANTSSPSAPGLSSTGASLTADPSNPVPTFDQQWFDDHGTQIASAVRSQLLNYHPLVDTINDL